MVEFHRRTPPRHGTDHERKSLPLLSPGVSIARLAPGGGMGPPPYLLCVRRS
jgi:hypothetical protein